MKEQHKHWGCRILQQKRKIKENDIEYVEAFLCYMLREYLLENDSLKKKKKRLVFQWILNESFINIFYIKFLRDFIILFFSDMFCIYDW